MAGPEFADFGNALLAGSSAAYQQGRGLREVAAEKRRQDAQPFIEPAVKGDMGAFAKVAAGDPATAAAVAQSLSRMDAATLAKAKAATDYTTGVTTGLLAAPEGDRERLYQQTRLDAQAKGMDISRWPANYDPAWVQMQHGYGIGAKSWFEQSQQNHRHATPAGGTPTAVDLPGQGGTAPAAAPGASGPPADLVPHFKAASTATGLPEPLLHAVAGAESRFDPNATSPAGAGGVMQLMPGTAKDLGVANARDPGSNILGGSTYLKQQLDKYGNLETALAAYNWGPGNVDSWLKSGADPARLPTETRNYIVEVKRRLGAGGAAQMPGPPQGLVPNAAMAQMPVPPQGLTPAGPPPAQMPQVSVPSRGVPGPIAQGDTPQADGSGTPMPPAQKGQLPVKAGFAEDDPTKYGYKQRGISKGGIVTPQVIEGGYFVYRNPQTGSEVLYKPGEAKATPPKGSFAGNALEAQYANVLENGDPSTFAYAQAYAHFSAPRTTVDDQGRPVTIQPNVSHIAPPTYRPRGAAPAQGQPGAAPPAAEATPASPPSNQTTPLPGGGSVTVGQSVAPKGPSNAEMAKYRDAEAEGKTIITALEDFRSEFRKIGAGDRFKSMLGATTPANTAYNNAALLAKGEALFNLGVLNGPDLAIIRRTLPDPSSFGATITSAKDMDVAVDKVINLIKERISQKGKSLGVQGAAPAGEQKGGDREKLLNDARTAIQQGADPAAVAKRLKDMGVEGGL